MQESSNNAKSAIEQRPERQEEHTGSIEHQFVSLANAEQALPRLHVPGAYTTTRDRWERLTTCIDIPATPEEVWSALTNPDALYLWLAKCHGSLLRRDSDVLFDFEDGEFFLCRSQLIEPNRRLRYLWRWLGIGQATSVDWQLEPTPIGTHVTVTEEAFNAPWDWQTWNGGGWPGILDQLAAYLRTGTSWRWPWRRMGPYAQLELPISAFEGWERLFAPSGLRFWLQATHGEFAPGQQFSIVLGDASGIVTMKIQEIAQPGEAMLSMLPYVTFSIQRPIWNCEVGGRLWIEPAGWNRSIFQVFHYNWENLPANLQLSERKLLTTFWVGAMRRARLLCAGPDLPGTMPGGPHSWS